MLFCVVTYFRVELLICVLTLLSDAMMFVVETLLAKSCYCLVVTSFGDVLLLLVVTSFAVVGGKCSRIEYNFISSVIQDLVENLHVINSTDIKKILCDNRYGFVLLTKKNHSQCPDTECQRYKKSKRGRSSNG